MLKENLKNVQNNIKKACERVGRKPEEVTLVAVSKMKPLSDIEELLETGQLEYGENYVQELCDKYENISKPVHWHMIGHLQTNKVKYIIDKVELIHSVDSLHLAKQIEKEAVKKGVDAQILVQVNIAQEDTKFGIEHSRTEWFCEIIFGKIIFAGTIMVGNFMLHIVKACKSLFKGTWRKTANK